MKQTLLIALLLGSLGIVGAQESPTKTGHYFGMGAGAVSGYGLLFRDWSGPVGWQVEGMPMLGAGTMNMNLGLSAFWLLNDSDWTRFFVYAGGMGAFSSVTYSEVASQSWSAGLGGGIGLEVILWDHIAIDLQGGYQLRYDGSAPFLGPTGEVAISYRL